MARSSPLPLLSDRFNEALTFACATHATQKRKGSDIPYVAHLLGVASIALENGADEEQAIAALLHDCVEDQDVSVGDIAERFGARVARMVADCTDSFGSDKPEWRLRKETYIAGLAAKPRESLLVSVSDKTHNARAIVDDLIDQGPALWSRFTGGREGTLWYYQALAEQFERLLPGPPSRRLAFAVAEMTRLAQESD